MTQNETPDVVLEEVETKVYQWTVLKRDPKADEVFVGPVWVEVGAIITDTSYYIGWDAPQEIGLLFGPGEYLLLHDGRFQRMTITAETRYSQVEEEA